MASEIYLQSSDQRSGDNNKMRIMLNEKIILSLGPNFLNGSGGGGDGLPPYYIPDGESYEVPLNKQAYAPYPIIGDGELIVNGKLLIGAN